MAPVAAPVPESVRVAIRVWLGYYGVERRVEKREHIATILNFNTDVPGASTDLSQISTS